MMTHKINSPTVLQDEVCTDEPKPPSEVNGRRIRWGEKHTEGDGSDLGGSVNKNDHGNAATDTISVSFKRPSAKVGKPHPWRAREPT